MRIILLIISLFIFTTVASAEIIYFKAGGAVKGKIVNKTDKDIQVDKGVGILTTYALDEVKKIVPEKNAVDQTQTQASGDSIMEDLISRKLNQQFTFQFNPPDGVLYKVKHKKTVVQDLGKLGGHVEVVTSKTKNSIRRSSFGFIVEAAPIWTNVVRDGLEVTDTLVSLLENFIISYDLDARGQVVAVHGYKDLMKKMAEKYSPAELQNLAAVFNEQTFIEREMIEWNNRVGPLLGRAVTIGENWEGTEEYNLPVGGKIILQTKTDVLALTQCGKSKCLKLRTSYHFKDDGEKEVSGQGIRFIDPNTMLIYSEAITRTTKIYDPGPGPRKISKTINEKKEYTADFSL